MDNDQLQSRYGKSARGHYWVRELISVPHPYVITGKHVAWAADHYLGSLSTMAIETGEREGIRCGMNGCRLTLAEHQQALLVACRGPLKTLKGKMVKELHDYLLKCKPLCDQDGWVGFAFVEVR